MTVEVEPEALRLLRDNRAYYFCSSECLRAFAAPEAARRSLARKLVVAWPLSVAVAVLTWGPAVPRAALVAGALAAVVQVYPASGFYRGAWDAIRLRVGNMDLLIACGSTAAFLYSAAVLLLPGRLPSATYFDASALIVTVILTGTYLEQLTRRRASSALRGLTSLLPSTVTLVEGTHERTVPLSELDVGARVRVAPGDRLPADGTVLEGVSVVDEAWLSGESAGTRKGPGDAVLAGATNLEGPLVVRVGRVGPATFVAHVGQLLEEAEMARVPLQSRADRLASVFAPLVLALAVGAGVGWVLLGRADASVGLLVFVTVAVTACPCAFGLATPAALLVGTGRAAERGILFRGGDAVERAASIDTVLLDKTGTLTVPEPEVGEVFAVPPSTEAEVVGIAAGLEVGIRHPLAAALRRAGELRGVAPSPFDEVQLEPGSGVVGSSVHGSAALVRGDAAEAAGADLAPIRPWVRRVEATGASWSVVLRDGRPVGGISFHAPLRDGALEAVGALRDAGIRTSIVTGDNARAAEAVAGEVGIRDVHAGASPEEKVALVRQYRGEGHRVAFVGDGVNDAAALAAADLGVALGTGPDLARDAGQVLLVRPDLRGVPEAIRTSRRIVGRVRANLIWAVGYNVVLLPIAAGALVPAFGFGVYRVLPVLGAVAMGLSSTTVLLSSLSLRRDRRPPTRATR